MIDTYSIGGGFFFAAVGIDRFVLFSLAVVVQLGVIKTSTVVFGLIAGYLFYPDLIKAGITATGKFTYDLINGKSLSRMNPIAIQQRGNLCRAAAVEPEVARARAKFSSIDSKNAARQSGFDLAALPHSAYMYVLTMTTVLKEDS